MMDNSTVGTNWESECVVLKIDLSNEKAYSKQLEKEIIKLKLKSKRKVIKIYL